MNSLNRRDFLKMLSLLPPGAMLPGFVKAPERPLRDASANNVLVVVFDTFSAQHSSVYGYARNTMPNLNKFAEKATVYHNHHAAGNWTTPGTASILTGTYPWTHHAFSERDSISPKVVERNIFTVFNDYYRIGYSHNTIANRFLYQFYRQLDLLKPQKELFTANDLSFDKLFPWDGDIAPLSWDRIMTDGEKGYTYSLFLAQLFQKQHQAEVADLRKIFPRGIPHTGESSYFTLEDAINWLVAQLARIPQPFVGYFHYLPPHRPYNTRREFINVFKNDDMGYYLAKPRHPVFSAENANKPLPLEFQKDQRQYYDEFILYVDAEFGRLIDSMRDSGLLDKTWVIFTSDHGEMFERGIFGHKTPLLYEPVVRVPLLIMEPGQQTRNDIYTPTSAVDLLPTLAQISGQSPPDWTEGAVLPPYSGVSLSTDRPIFALEASDSKEDQPLGPASIMMIKGKYKLAYYFGYSHLQKVGPLFELFDIENDPEELVNLFSEDSAISRELRDELLNKVKEVNKIYLEG